jgi:hypothetical protein
MAVSIKNIDEIKATEAPEIEKKENSSNKKGHHCKSKSEKMKKPKLKIVSIDFFSEDGKRIEGIDKEQTVVLKMNYEKPGGYALMIDLGQSDDYYFEFDGKAIKENERLLLKDSDIQVNLNVKFYR